jgi:acyl-CoA thioesterase-1
VPQHLCGESNSKKKGFGVAFLRGLLLFLAIASVPAASQAQAAGVKLVALGDSLTAGYGLGPGEAFPNKLQALLRAKGLSVDINNAGVSGDTSSGGLERLDWSVPDGTDGVILCLGANDMLRGIAPEITEKNLVAIVAKLKARKIAVLLVGLKAAPNLGSDYAKAFETIFPKLAAANDLVFVPFLLEGVAAEPSLNQADGMHPNGQGTTIVARTLLPAVESFLGKIGK